MLQSSPAGLLAKCRALLDGHPEWNEAKRNEVVGRRLKQSGMFWSQAEAENLLSLRCLAFGPYFDDA